jgi:hypothetical protein
MRLKQHGVIFSQPERELTALCGPGCHGLRGGQAPRMFLHAFNAEKFSPNGIMIIPGRQLVLKSKNAASQSGDMVFNGLPRQIRSPAPLVRGALLKLIFTQKLCDRHNFKIAPLDLKKYHGRSCKVIDYPYRINIHL